MDVMSRHIKNIWGVLLLLFFVPFQGNSQEFSDGYISAIVSYQRTIAQGDTMPITIKIIKNDITGFAKFKCTAPQNIQILPPDFVNASATLKDTVLEVIWVEIPFEKEFLIEYKLVIPNSSPLGSFSYSGSFYYLIDKDIKVLKFNNLPFDISDDKGQITKSQSDYKVQAAKRERNVKPVLMAKDERSTLPIPVEDTTANKPITINNLTEVPSTPLVEDTKSPEPKVDIPTENASKDSTIAPTPTDTVIAITPPEIKDSVPTEPKIEQVAVTEQPKIEEPKPVAVEPAKVKEPEKANSGKGIEFKVQIVASRKKMTSAQLKRVYKGKQEIEEEVRGDGWYRYSIAKTSSYSEARKSKKQSGVANAFISSFSDGAPIKLSEALNKAKPNEEKSYGKIFYAVQVLALNNYMPLSEVKAMFNSDKLMFVEKEAPYYKYLIGYFYSFREANAYRLTIGKDVFVVPYMNGKRLDKTQTIK